MPSSSNRGTDITDLGHAPPLQHYMESEDKKGGRASSGITGNTSIPNLLALSQYYMERKVIGQDKTTPKDPVVDIKTIKGRKVKNVESVSSNRRKSRKG